MTYIRRAIKYFIQTCLLLAIIIGSTGSPLQLP